MTKIYCFGNEFIKEDSLAKKISDEIKINGFDFVKCETLEDLEGDIIILDVVKGIKDVTLINNLDEINDARFVSSHDFDLGTELKLRKAVGQFKKIKIIGIPQSGDKGRIIKGIKKILVAL